MKKFLAILLAITMIATFIPSAFADGGEETYDGVKMVYDLMSLVNGVDYGAGTNIKSTLNYTTTSGLFRYVRSSATNTSQAMNVVGDEVTASNKITFGGSSGYGYVRLWNAHYVCFEVVVPEDGTYTLATEYLQATRGGTVNIHITPADEFYALTTLSTAKVRDDKVLGEAIGSYDCKGNATNENFTATSRQNPICFEKTLSAGKYIVTYQSVGAEGTVGTFTLSSGTNPEVITNGGKFIDYDVQTVMADNSIYYVSVSQDAVAEAKKMNYNMTNGFFEVSNAKGTITVGGSAATTYHFFKLAENATIEFKVNVPEEDTYFLRTNYQVAGSSYGTTVAVLVDGEKKGEYNCSSSSVTNNFTGGDTGTWINNEIVTDAGVLLSAGEHTIAFTVPSDGTSAVKYGTICSFELITGKLGTLTTDMDGFVKIDNTTLAVDEAANILGAVVCSSDGSVKAQSDANTTYESSDTSVATVSGATITAVGAGTADITTTVGDTTAKRTITVVNKPAGDTVSFAADNVGKLYVNNEEQEYTDLSLLSLNRGDTVMIVADTSDTGKTFRGWVRGSADYGRLVSNSAEYEFTAMTHTFLTAVYSETTTADDVEYYGWNEQYITTLPTTEEAPTAPTLTGYEFAEWVLGQSDDNIARKVAQYTAEATTYIVSVPEGVSKSVEGGKYIYDAKVTCTANEAVYWYRDNKLVDFGTTYSFYLWDNTSITTLASGNNGAKIMLDKPKKEAYMIEYDKGTASVVEVGIIFGDSKDITIDNCKEKMNSQRSDFTHGQFSATADEYTNARGYLIYNDKGTYRVIYAD
ncbi:MAG: hypothetical protein E7441_10965 [Ruminococcaceae bacterium]|nr:hypothetical protein [Oscillospiraceae bacterium]